MTVLQLILLASHGLLGLLMYKTGFADGLVEGRIKSFQEQR
jgi:phosphotransacetylase